MNRIVIGIGTVRFLGQPVQMVLLDKPGDGLATGQAELLIEVTRGRIWLLTPDGIDVEYEGEAVGFGSHRQPVDKYCLWAEEAVAMWAAETIRSLTEYVGMNQAVPMLVLADRLADMEELVSEETVRFINRLRLVGRDSNGNRVVSWPTSDKIFRVVRLVDEPMKGYIVEPMPGGCFGTDDCPWSWGMPSYARYGPGERYATAREACDDLFSQMVTIEKMPAVSD